jgi:hypothetical protein
LERVAVAVAAARPNWIPATISQRRFETAPGKLISRLPGADARRRSRWI